MAGNLQKSPIFSVTIAQPLEKVKLAALTVLDLAGNLSACGAPAPLGNGRGAGGVAGGAGNDASSGVDGKGGAGLLRPLERLSVFNEQESSVDVGSLAGKSSGGKVFVPSS